MNGRETPTAEPLAGQLRWINKLMKLNENQTLVNVWFLLSRNN